MAVMGNRCSTTPHADVVKDKKKEFTKSGTRRRQTMLANVKRMSQARARLIARDRSTPPAQQRGVHAAPIAATGTPSRDEYELVLTPRSRRWHR